MSRRGVVMTRHEFYIAVKALSFAFSTLRVPIQEDDNVDDILSAWHLEEYSCPFRGKNAEPDVILVHPPVLRPSLLPRSSQPLPEPFILTRHDDENDDESANEIRTATTENSRLDELCSTHPPYEEETTTDRNLSGMNTSTSNEISERQRRQVTMVEWMFSVAYHETYSVPVLYFRAQCSDGIPLTRRNILFALQHQCSTDHREEDDTWNFISQEEHCITGIPSFFLHPCQTALRLQTITNCSNSTRVHDDNNKDEASADLLLTWMSMILPAVRFRISVQTFRHLQQQLKNGIS